MSSHFIVTAPSIWSSRLLSPARLDLDDLGTDWSQIRHVSLDHILLGAKTWESLLCTVTIVVCRPHFSMYFMLMKASIGTFHPESSTSAPFAQYHGLAWVASLLLRGSLDHWCRSLPVTGRILNHRPSKYSLIHMYRCSKYSSKYSGGVGSQKNVFVKDNKLNSMVGLQYDQ